MSVSYHQDPNRKYMRHQDSSSSYDQGYNSQPRHYSHSITSDGFSDISLDPYSSQQQQQRQQPYYQYNNGVYSPDDSRRQVLDVQRLPLNDGRTRTRDSSADSDVYSHRGAPSIISSAGRDADIESITSHQTHTTVTSYGTESTASGYDQYRYNGELYRPVAAPRKVNSQVKKLFGEIHPRMLRPEEKPIYESGEETEDTMSVDSFITPRPAPRASMRMKSRSVEFIEEEEMRLENSKLQSILKSASMPSRLDSLGNKMVVRFEYVDKHSDNRSRRDITDYSDIDSDHGGKSKKKKNKQMDVWSHVAPVGPKPARNARGGSQKSSTNRRRSSSADRSRQSSRSGSKNRSSSASSTSRRAQQSPSMSRKLSQKGRGQPENTNGYSSESKADTENGHVTVTVSKQLVTHSCAILNQTLLYHIISSTKTYFSWILQLDSFTLR